MLALALVFGAGFFLPVLLAFAGALYRGLFRRSLRALLLASAMMFLLVEISTTGQSLALKFRIYL